jgi:diacylglycerol O-acyltransferase/trehalose O-mycolyltransferase
MSRRVLQAGLLGLVAWIAGCGSSDRLSGELSALASDLDPAAQSLSLKLMGSQRLSDRLHEPRLSSPAMEAEIPVRVLRPQRYDSRKAQGYPVFYLLHGCCSEGRGYGSWTDDGDLEPFTANMDPIFVMPEGGNGGLYADWNNGGAGGPPRWETFHIREQLPWLEQIYRV